MDIEHLTNCTIIKFSVGSYRTAVLPMIKNCRDTDVAELSLKIFKVNDVQIGFDNGGKNVETKVTLNDEETKIVLHFYNTNFKIKVDGKTAANFVDKFLAPHFKCTIVQSIKMSDLRGSNTAACLLSAVKELVPQL